MTLHFRYTAGMTSEYDRAAATEPETCAERRALRADAERNRDSIVEAARAVFAERGLDVPLEEIAQRAGVGIATLYRRFPTRDDLIAASFECKMAEYAAAAREALLAPTGWEGFCGYVERICAMQAADRGLQDVLTLTFPTAKALEVQRSRAFEDVAEVIRRAKADGALRPDFVRQDLVLLLMANAGVIHGTRDGAPDAWKRVVALILEGCRADRAQPLPEAPTPDQMGQAMRRLACARARR
jgi:AcrR family transcriptional regulator